MFPICTAEPEIIEESRLSGVGGWGYHTSSITLKRPIMNVPFCPFFIGIKFKFLYDINGSFRSPEGEIVIEEVGPIILRFWLPCIAAALHISSL